METLIFNRELGTSAEILKRGGLVAVPTETVYGLAANAFDANAVRRIYEVKGRPETKPISLLVSGMADVECFCKNIPEEAYRLASVFWPGPLTMILEKRQLVPDIVTAGGKTVGVRCPDNALTLSLIRAAGVPLAAPSANISGAPSPKNAEAVKSSFCGKIDCILDGGVCTVGIESTIVDLTCVPPKILRVGGLAPEAIFQLLQIGGVSG